MTEPNLLNDPSILLYTKGPLGALLFTLQLCIFFKQTKMNREEKKHQPSA